MNSGVLTFATRGKAFNSVGTHQKFDRAAYRMVSPLVDHRAFPLRKEILRFEGIGGPDGLKFKGHYNTDHLWDPINQIGNLPLWVESHRANMTRAIECGDRIEASFHAGYMAHYLTDSLTPAHHTSHKLLAAEYQDKSKTRQRWLYWGRKGLMSQHVAFEAGISSSIIFTPIRVEFDRALFEHMQDKGLAEVVKDESLKIAKLELYDQFLTKGWSTGLARAIKSTVVPRIPQLVSAAWLHAYAQAGHEPMFTASPSGPASQ